MPMCFSIEIYHSLSYYIGQESLSHLLEKYKNNIKQYKKNINPVGWLAPFEIYIIPTMSLPTSRAYVALDNGDLLSIPRGTTSDCDIYDYQFKKGNEKQLVTQLWNILSIASSKLT